MTLRTVALLARTPGVLILDELLANPKIHLLKVITHSLLPKAEGGLTRPEMNVFYDKCLRRTPSVPIVHKDGPEECATVANAFRTLAPFDLLLVCNWRAVVPAEALAMARHCVNIHRGDLPKYPGKRPVLQALQAKDELFAVTAHRMTPELDQGEVLRKEWHQARPRYDETLEDAEVRIREEMTPLYGRLVRHVIAGLE